MASCLLVPPRLSPVMVGVSSWVGTAVVVHRPGRAVAHFLQKSRFPFDVMDVSTADLKPHLEKVCEYIEAAMRRGESVLVHRVSPAPPLVIAYLIRNRGMSYDTAFAIVCRQRACAKPNAGFVQTLKDWETAWHSDRRHMYK
ncbi:hypothetical protein BDZ89DRAFT_1041907 [Hymenopellis radicata]|nr:hypothetical protein BDZ89DRAFT_1041907 [Hymenopellis radicata]